MKILLMLFLSIHAMAIDKVAEQYDLLEKQSRAEAWGFQIKKTAQFEIFAKEGAAPITGYIPQDHDEKLYLDILADDTLPPAFDWKDKLGGLPPVRDQGHCGSCWAHATSGALELNYYRAHPNPLMLFSEQEILSCSRAGSCDGGTFSAHNYQMRHGEGLLSDFPYKAKDLKCKPGEAKAKLSHWGFVGTKFRKPSVDQVKTAIYNYGPVAVTVAANSAMTAYKGGLFGEHGGCSNGGVNHMVILTGWDEDGWHMRNSWGAKWGEQGYMRIKYGCSRIAQDVSIVELEAK